MGGLSTLSLSQRQRGKETDIHMSDRGYSIPLLLSRSGTIIHFAMERIFLTLLSKMFLDTTYTPT